ncbi:SOS response-associated peptidase family protein [Falsirhodobacter sp. 1013]|uniref:SOS response-associated peptidase family protein n=1 Tax=Falsirhodobacter sp. 1013 TaxID=3417566 RepID=UPI003EB6DC35
MTHLPASRIAAAKALVYAAHACHPEDREEALVSILAKMWDGPRLDVFKGEHLDQAAALWATSATDRVLDAYLKALTAETGRRATGAAVVPEPASHPVAQPEPAAPSRASTPKPKEAWPRAKDRPAVEGAETAMCNLYRHTRAQDALREIFRGFAVEDRLGNLPAQGRIYPNDLAPVLRHADGEGQGLELVMARWGLPSPEQFHSKNGIDKGVTNIRNTGSPHWRRWLNPRFRCLVPLTAFSEPVHDGKAWFTPADDRPAFFAGLHVLQWTSIRKLKDGETTDDLYAFLTTEPNAEVAKVHPKAMPVILTEPDEWDAWLHEPWGVVQELQRPLPDGALSMELVAA